MSYQANRELYLSLIRRFLRQEVAPAEFVRLYMAQWKSDRDEEWASPDLQALSDRRLGSFLDRVFTACDCLEEDPTSRADHELSADELRLELAEKLKTYEDDASGSR